LKLTIGSSVTSPSILMGIVMSGENGWVATTAENTLGWR